MNTIRLNAWGKLLLVVVPLALVAAVALVRTAQKVETLGAEVDKRALRETVDQQYQALIREIGAVRDDIRALRAEVGRR